MFMPNKSGIYTCEDCEYATDDVFGMLHHCELEFTWNVKMAGRYNFDLFQLLKTLNLLLEEGSIDTAREYIQGIAMTFVNTFDGDIDIQKLWVEVMARKNTNKIIDGMEKMLDDENK